MGLFHDIVLLINDFDALSSVICLPNSSLNLISWSIFTNLTKGSIGLTFIDVQIMNRSKNTM